VVSAVIRLVPETVRGLSLEQYDFLVAAGQLDGERVELLAGELVSVPQISPEHASTVDKLADLLRAQLPAGWRVRAQSPLAVPPGSEPEPDVAVVPDGDYDHQHPRTALLVVEVSVSTPRTDLDVKAAVYAAAGVAEYWVVDIAARVVHVHRAVTAGGYGVVTEYEGVLRSRTEPAFAVDLRDVLPRG